MKAIPTLALAAALFLFLQPAQAQQAPPINTPDYNKPNVFSELPERLPLRISTLENLLVLAKGSSVNNAIADGLVLTGIVVSKFAAADSSLQSLVIKTTTRQGAVFSFSRIRKKDGSIRYSGQLLTPAAGDALELVSENGNWLLRKRPYYDLVSE